MEMMRSMKGAFDGFATKVDSSIEAQDRMAKEFPDKLDNFATNFKQEVLGEVQSKMSGLTSSVEELQKNIDRAAAETTWVFAELAARTVEQKPQRSILTTEPETLREPFAFQANPGSRATWMALRRVGCASTARRAGSPIRRSTSTRPTGRRGTRGPSRSGT